MSLHIIKLIVSFIGLHIGSEILIKSSEKLSQKIHMPAWFTTGLLLSIGTSIPEIMVSFSSSLSGHQQLAISNAIGSNIANICLAFAIPWILFSIGKIKIPAIFIWEFLLIQALFAIILIYYKLNIISGILLTTLFIVMLITKIKIAANTEKVKTPNKYDFIDTIKLLTSILLVPLSSYYLVESSEDIIIAFDISEMFFGIIFIALGTSIPEIYSTFLAMRKKKYNTAIMNIVGSNIINSSIVTSIICFIGGYQVTNNREYFDISFMMFLALAMFIFVNLKIKHKSWGIIIFISYLGYLFSWT